MLEFLKFIEMRFPWLFENLGNVEKFVEWVKLVNFGLLALISYIEIITLFGQISQGAEL